MRRLRTIAALLVIVSACGGGTAADEADSGSETADESAHTVEADSGLASLTLAPGSLPEGVSADEIGLAVAVDEQAEPGTPSMLVQLSPDGLVLEGPATLTLDLPQAALDRGFMVIHQSGDTIEFVEGEIDLTEDGFSFTTAVEHFSRLEIFADSIAFVHTTVTVTPVQMAVGQSQQVMATITPKTEPVVFWVSFASDPRGTWRRVKMSPPSSITVEDAALYRTAEARYWEPYKHEVALTAEGSGWRTEQVTFKCNSPNELGPHSWAKALLRVSLVEVGEPRSNDSLSLAEAFGGAAAPESHPDVINALSLLDLEPGASVDVFAYPRGLGTAECVSSSTEDSSTSTSSTTQGGSDTTVAAAAPRHLEETTPVAATETGTGTVTVQFGAGDGSADAQSVSETSALYQLAVNVSSGTQTASIFYSATEGQVVTTASLTESADAEQSEDGGGTVTQGTGGQVEATWLDANTLQLAVTGFDLPEDGSISVQTAIQETPEGEIYTFELAGQ